MSKRWYPVINYETCINCKACIEKCSHGVYDKENEEPKVIYPEGCIEGCRGCQNLCPAGSIEYVGDIKQEKQFDCGCDENTCCS